MVRAYLPQSYRSNIHTNYPPQGLPSAIVDVVGDSALVQTLTLSTIVQTETLSALVQTEV